MDLVLTSLIAVVLILIAVYVVLWNALTPTIPVKGKTNIPGPGWRLPIIGDGWRFAQVRTMKDLMEVAESILDNADRAVTIQMGPKLMVLVTDPKMGEIILNSPKATNKDPDIYGGFNEFTDGVFSRNGKCWRDLRRPLNKMLQSTNVMENYYDTFTANAEKMCAAFNGVSGKEPVNVLKNVQKYMLDIVYETLLGIPANSSYPIEEQFSPTQVSRMVAICLQMAMNPIYKFQFLLGNFTPVKREYATIKKRVHKWGKRIVDSRMKILEENSLNPHDPLFEPESFTDATIQATHQEPHTDDEYRALSKPYDLIIAGFDTTAVAVATTVLFLAQHPEYQEKAYQEQMAIMGDTLRPPTQEEISKMDYLYMVFMETVRHVGVPGVYRVLTSEIKIDDYVYPEGTSVYLSIHYFNMKPEYWVKTKEFYPDNFLPEHAAKRPRMAWMPFSSGARVCPGKTFADAVAKVMLSMLIRKFKFTTTMKFEEMEYEYFLMLESMKGYPVTLERRSVIAA